MVSHKMATLEQLQTFYSVEDVYMMLEIISIDNHNRKIAMKNADKDRQ